MNIACFIARRYFISKKKRNFINIISGMSVIGVAFGAMALIVSMSVFNGLEDLIRSIYGSFDPNLKVTATTGKSFEADSNLVLSIKNIQYVSLVTEVVEDNALVKYNDKQAIVKMKGVSDNFHKQYHIDRYIQEGKPTFNDHGVACAIIGRGIQYKLGVDMQNRFFQLQFWYPKSGKKIELNPEKSFNSANLFPGAVLELEKKYDDHYVFVPLHFAVELMNYGQRRTSLEIHVSDPKKINEVKDEMQKLLGEAFNIQTVEEQHQSMLRALKIERLFVNIAFTFILLVSSLNIFFTLTMLAIEKKNDMNILYSMGASRSLIKNIFLAEGFIVAFIGAIGGLAMGFIICYAQQTYGFVSINSETSLVNAYPVKMKLLDFVIAGIIIFTVAFFISYQPALKASKVEGRLP